MKKEPTHIKIAKNFIDVLSEIDAKYFPDIKYYGDHDAGLAIHYAVECFNNGVRTYNNMIRIIAENTKDTQENIHTIVSKYIEDFGEYVFKPDMVFKTQKQRNRYARLMSNGEPKMIRCYDNGGPDKVRTLKDGTKSSGTLDRYTVVFTGRYTHKTNGAFWYVAMNAGPFHPQGFYQHGESNHQPIDRPTYGHLGKKIRFEDLPEDCQKAVIQDYLYLWDFTDNNGKPIN